MFPPHPGSLLDAWPKGRHLILYDKTCDKLSENPAHALYYYTEPGDPAAIVVGPEVGRTFRLWLAGFRRCCGSEPLMLQAAQACSGSSNERRR